VVAIMPGGHIANVALGLGSARQRRTDYQSCEHTSTREACSTQHHGGSGLHARNLAGLAGSNLCMSCAIAVSVIDEDLRRAAASDASPTATLSLRLARHARSYGRVPQGVGVPTRTGRQKHSPQLAMSPPIQNRKFFWLPNARCDSWFPKVAGCFRMVLRNRGIAENRTPS
jgi:hypothetical protein